MALRRLSEARLWKGKKGLWYETRLMVPRQVI
jgi:hypothetical protein